MWVVKIGGSLNQDPLLPAWLELLSQLGGGRVTVVCGGGGFADEVRRSQSHWHFGDLAAHNMAVLAMAQSAWLAKGLAPQLQLASSESELRRVLHGGHAAVWMPQQSLRDADDATTGWHHTSDSIALDLARQLNAERLVVVKSCFVDPAMRIPDLVDAGVLDTHFATLAAGAGFPIDVIQRSELARVRSLLLGNQRSLAS